jgi:hypothetical protein
MPVRLSTLLSQPIPYAAERLAFRRHVASLALDPVALALDPSVEGFLHEAFPGEPTECAIASEQAIALAQAYGCEVSWVDSLVDTFPNQVFARDASGCYQQAQDGRGDHIFIESGLSPSLRAFILWHEVAHLIFSHTGDTLPVGDLVSSSTGGRSQEYIANAFASIMFQKSVSQKQPNLDAFCLGYVFIFESVFDALKHPTRDPHLWSVAEAVLRAQEFLLQNRSLILNQVALAREILAGQRLAVPSVHVAVIPLSQQVSRADFPDLDASAVKGVGG